MNYVKVFLIGVAVALVVIGAWHAYNLGYEAGIKSVIVTGIDTVYVDKGIEAEEITPEFIYKVRKDTITKWRQLNIDSLWLEALAYWQGNQYGGEYIAYKDTTFIDDNFQAKISFNSPIPLHPLSHFNFDFKYSEKQITKFVEIEKWDKMDYYIRAGSHLSLKDFKNNYSATVGYQYSPYKIFSFGNEINYFPNNRTTITTHLTIHF